MSREAMRKRGEELAKRLGLDTPPSPVPGLDALLAEVVYAGIWGRPQLALVSAGRGNSFGHPAPDVLMRLESIGTRVLRTDRDGEITVTTDGRTVR